jgi:hypothetical protein
MLSVLTDGLREVEVNQNRWLEENDSLSNDLEAAMSENSALHAELGRAMEALDVCKEQLLDATGRPFVMPQADEDDDRERPSDEVHITF